MINKLPSDNSSEHLEYQTMTAENIQKALEETPPMQKNLMEIEH